MEGIFRVNKCKEDTSSLGEMILASFSDSGNIDDIADILVEENKSKNHMYH